jgi:transposase InsO family protein
VVFLFFTDKAGNRVKWFQYTAIDDATRLRALRILDRHTQPNAIRFIDYAVKNFPFRIRTIQTDNGHKSQSKTHWHIEDLGMEHVYIKPGTPRLTGKMERSYLTDKYELYQLLDYKGDVDLEEKLTEWDAFYNLHRTHAGKTPYEVLKENMAA